MSLANTDSVNCCEDSDVDDSSGTCSNAQDERLPDTARADKRTPTLFHRLRGQASILALVIAAGKIFVGTHDGEILIWCLQTFELLTSVKAHRASVLGLCLSEDSQFLFSCGVDSIVNVWEVPSLRRIYSIYSTYDVGDVFCVAYSSTLRTIYLGAQNTSIQWYDLRKSTERRRPNPSAHPSARQHHFFDSMGPSGTSRPRPRLGDIYRDMGGEELDIDQADIVPYSHNGYIHCMLLVHDLNCPWQGETLVTGGGDGAIKLWATGSAADDGILLERTLRNGDDAILSFALDSSILYCGKLEGGLDIWDLDTCQLIRQVKVSPSDVLAISAGHDLIFAGSAAGHVKIYNMQYSSVSTQKAHDHLILASAVATVNEKELYVTGGNDGSLAIWDISQCFDRPRQGNIVGNEEMLLSLARFVSYKTISCRPEFAQDCRRGASFLTSLFKRFGAITELLSANSAKNPVVYARFSRNSARTVDHPKTVLFYGHYDVVFADATNPSWKSDPFILQALNGYLYGRGVSDNKGPILAALYAVADLVRRSELETDVVFIIEGEEESGSTGFDIAIRRHKNLIGKIDWILLANSYWITDDIPCLTYGLRGVVRASIVVTSEHPDMHSGVDGSQLIHEALKDLIAVVAQLSGHQGHVAIPGFYSNALRVSETDKEQYRTISRILVTQNSSLGEVEDLAKSLAARWAMPSLTVHSVQSSGSTNSSVMSHTAQADVSLRLVPDQTTAEIVRMLEAHIQACFKSLKSTNRIKITITHTAEPWLGDPSSTIFKVLEHAILETWSPTLTPISPPILVNSAPSQLGRPSPSSSPMKLIKPATSPPPTSTTLSSIPTIRSPPRIITSGIECRNDAVNHARSEKPRFHAPLYIREGGSIPAIRFLEQEFNAKAAHLPCGQASDSAHLDNERFRVRNLYNARDIFRRVFVELGLQ